VTTPPQIVAGANRPEDALLAFIVQELEHWGFGVEASPVNVARVTADGVPLTVTVMAPGASS
jgi:DUF1009 family protein